MSSKLASPWLLPAHYCAYRMLDQSIHLGLVQQQIANDRQNLLSRKKMEVSWQQLDPRLQNGAGLDDIMRFDLRHFCRRMQPPQEPHHKYAHPHLPCLCAPSMSSCRAQQAPHYTCAP